MKIIFKLVKLCTASFLFVLIMNTSAYSADMHWLNGAWRLNIKETYDANPQLRGHEKAYLSGLDDQLVVFVVDRETQNITAHIAPDFMISNVISIEAEGQKTIKMKVLQYGTEKIITWKKLSARKMMYQIEDDETQMVFVKD